MTERKPTTADEREYWAHFPSGRPDWLPANHPTRRLCADVDRYEPIVQAVAKAPCLCRNAERGQTCLGCDAKAALGLPLPDKAHGSKPD